MDGDTPLSDGGMPLSAGMPVPDFEQQQRLPLPRHHLVRPNVRVVVGRASIFGCRASKGGTGQSMSRDAGRL